MSAREPQEVAEVAVGVGTKKVHRRWDKVLVSAFLGGAYIAFGGLVAITVSSGLAPDIWGTLPTRRNTSSMEVFDGSPSAGSRIVRCGRRCGRRAGRCRRGVWSGVLAPDRGGQRTEEAARAVGVSEPVGVSWFRHAGGMPPHEPGRAHGPLSVVRRA